MDLLIVKLPRGYTLCAGSDEKWSSCNAVVAVFRRAGWQTSDVLSALAHDDDLTIHAPLAVILAAVALRLSAWDFDYEDRGAEPTEQDEPIENGTLCTGCRVDRACFLRHLPLPADPSTPRLTEEALAQHTRAQDRDRSRSPVRAENLPAEASR
jgi:hypothetical protein